MARRPREDAPGCWHHVINRALARRPYFERRSDKRYFLSRMALEVRAGRLEVHAFCLMTTHYHLLVRSPEGQLSEAMRRIQNSYSRYFNRIRRRDGPLIRARFFSKPVRGLTYRRAVVRYIDANPVRARISQRPENHEFGSAQLLVGPCRPPWLSTDWIEREVCERTGAEEFGAAGYRAVFGLPTSAQFTSLNEMLAIRMAANHDLDPLDDLVGAKPREVREWMVRKAKLADGMSLMLPVCGTNAICTALRSVLEESGEWLLDQGERVHRGSLVARAGLLKGFAGQSVRSIAKLMESSRWMAMSRIELHRRAILEDSVHAKATSLALHRALESTHGMVPDDAGVLIT